MSRHLVSIVGNSFNCLLGAMAGNTETLVRHCLVGAHAAGCVQAKLMPSTEIQKILVEREVAPPFKSLTGLKSESRMGWDELYPSDCHNYLSTCGKVYL